MVLENGCLCKAKEAQCCVSRELPQLFFVWKLSELRTFHCIHNVACFVSVFERLTDVALELKLGICIVYLLKREGMKNIRNKFRQRRRIRWKPGRKRAARQNSDKVFV